MDLSAGAARGLKELGGFVATALDTQALHELAVHAAKWGTPIVSFDAMRQAFFRDAGAQHGDVVYLSRFADWRFQIATPNASTRYVYFNFTTKDGPIVVEIPAAAGAGLFGSILDAWQVPLVDVGPQGSDQGKGGKYLLLPPESNESVPAGHIAVATYNGYAAFRAISEDASPAAVDRALGLVRQIRVYPLARAGNPPVTRAIDIAGKLFDGIMHYDETFFATLAKMVTEEPALPRDADTLESLKELGIAKGKRFAPDGSIRAELESAAHDAQRQLIDAEPGEGDPFWPNSAWRAPSSIGAKTGFTFVTNTGLDVDARAQTFFMACAPPKVLGKASMYLATYADSAGKPLSGDGSYRLRLPPNVPAAQFWALTVYDAETCGFIRNSPKIEVNSYQEGVAVNADGSIDLYIGHSAPAAGAANWVALTPGRPWFPFLRFYGPKPALFDQSWRAPDIERVG
jgi:hypothetical protein